MSAKTHGEIVLQEVVRQWPDRVRARARLRGRPLGHDDVSDNRARKLWNQVNVRAADVIAQSPPGSLTPWQATKLLYPQRDILLQSAKNEGGWKGMVAFEARMNRTPKGEQETGERDDTDY